MATIERFVLGGAFCLLALSGLGLAAHHGGGLYAAGVLMFLAAVGLLFAQITSLRFRPGPADTGSPDDESPDAESGLPLPPILRSFAEIRARGDRAMKATGAIEKFLIGGVLGLFAIASLFVAARHDEGASYWGGLAFFAVCIGLIFYQITTTKHGSDGAH